MNKYLHKFNENFFIDDYLDNHYIEPFVGSIEIDLTSNMMIYNYNDNIDITAYYYFSDEYGQICIDKSSMGSGAINMGSGTISQTDIWNGDDSAIAVDTVYITGEFVEEQIEGQIVDGIYISRDRILNTNSLLGQLSGNAKAQFVLNRKNNIPEYQPALFLGCADLENIKINMPAVPRYFCLQCISLTNVKLTNKVTQIDEYAFAGCGSLSNITIPKSVKCINEKAFYMSNLNQIRFLSKTPPDFSGNVPIFKSNGSYTLTVYVPIGCSSVYNEALSKIQLPSGWSTPNFIFVEVEDDYEL